MMANGWSSRLKHWQSVWLPMFFFSGLTVVMCWPMVSRMTSVAIGHVGDNWYYIWLMGWFQKALFELHQNPLVVTSHNYPFGWALAYSEITLSNVMIGLPFTLLGGPTFGYNATLLLSFVLSGLVVYGWVKSLTQNVAAALIAGALFAFMPYRLAHAYGHLPLMGTQWLALHFAGLHGLLYERHVNWKSAGMAGVGLGLSALSSLYYTYMSLIITAIYVAGYILFVERRAWQRVIWWRNLSLFMLIALPFLIGATGPHLQLSRLGEANHRPLADVDIWSASPTDFLLPSPVHFLWGEWVRTHFDRSRWIEQTVYVGMVTIILVIVASVRRKQRTDDRQAVGLWLWTSACVILLAMGTTLHWLGEPVTSNVLGALSRWHNAPPNTLPLPGYFLFKFLPFYDGMRVWTRYGIYANLFLAVIAGMGYTYLLQSIKRPMSVGILWAVTLALIVIDFYPGFSISEVQGHPVDDWLARQPDSGVVVQMPINLSTSPAVIYSSLTHGKPLLGMFYGAYLPNTFNQIYPTLLKFPDPASLQVLRSRDVRYVVIDSSFYPQWTQTRAQIQNLGLRELAVLGEQYVYELSRP